MYIIYMYIQYINISYFQTTDDSIDIKNSLWEFNDDDVTCNLTGSLFDVHVRRISGLPNSLDMVCII